MPANLTPQYIELRTKLQQSKDPEERIELLQEMVAIIPKHKGTNKILGELRSKLATLRKESQNKPSKHKVYNPYRIARQGAGQVVIIGFPNVGKSSLVASLTKVHTPVASYPFTTDKPIVGMMPYENINIQLIDTPPITDELMDPNLIDLIRRADLILLVVDTGSDDSLEQIESVKTRLEQTKLKLVMQHDEEEDEENEFILKKVIIVANKTDLDESQDRIETLKELYSQELPIFGLSAEKHEFDAFKRMIFYALDIIRVYTKPVNKKPDLTDPVVLYRGSTVVDAAEEIHRDFAENLKFAKVWGSGGKYNGQSVSRDHPLEDGNIVEFHVPE